MKEIFCKMPLYEMHETISGGYTNFLAFCKDKITVLKKDGSIYSDLAAQVTEQMILIPDTTVPIVIGDTILRSLPKMERHPSL